MKISANEIKVGNILEFENKLWKVLKLEHTKPGKGGAYIQVELKDINSGTKKMKDLDLMRILKKHILNKETFSFFIQVEMSIFLWTKKIMNKLV